MYMHFLLALRTLIDFGFPKILWNGHFAGTFTRSEGCTLGLEGSRVKTVLLLRERLPGLEVAFYTQDTMIFEWNC